MSYTDPIDATRYGFEEWIRFAFDRPVAKERWYFSEELNFVCDPSVVLTYYTRLFRDPKPLLSPYDENQIEQGLWFVVSYQLGDWLWDEDIPLPLRLECIAAMPAMFREFLIDHELDTSVFMWWDMLRFFVESPDRQNLENAMLPALDAILQVPSRHCQLSALHGLGHLEHESKEAVIRRFLATNPGVDDEMRTYAEHAIAGDVL